MRLLMLMIFLQLKQLFIKLNRKLNKLKLMNMLYLSYMIILIRQLKFLDQNLQIQIDYTFLKYIKQFRNLVTKILINKLQYYMNSIYNYQQNLILINI